MANTKKASAVSRISKRGQSVKEKREAETSGSEPCIDSFRGFSLINLDPDTDQADTRAKSTKFGLKKAKLILEHIDAIERFVSSEGTEC